MAKILIVDDDENNRLLLATLLEYAGHTVLEASDGRAGVEIAASALPDVIVVDLSLPDFSGVELIRRLRAEPRTARCTIALYTATQLTPALSQLVDAYDIRGIIPKPGDPQHILEGFEQLTTPEPVLSEGDPSTGSG